MILKSSRPERRTTLATWVSLALSVMVACVLAGCTGMGGNNVSDYHATAYAPTSSKDVVVLVSLRAKMVYVMEGNKALLVTPTSIGTPDHPTPTGHYRVTNKIPNKRSGEYGFWVNGSDIRSGSAGASPGAGFHYVGYPMANWVEFTPGYGFHEGYVWPVPRSHGCLRLHKNVSVKFYKLVQVGTPVIIANSLPQDDTIGKNVDHPTDYKDPDPAASLMISPEFFNSPRDSELVPAGGSTAATPQAAAATATPAQM